MMSPMPLPSACPIQATAKHRGVKRGSIIRAILEVPDVLTELRDDCRLLSKGQEDV